MCCSFPLEEETLCNEKDTRHKRMHLYGWLQLIQLWPVTERDVLAMPQIILLSCLLWARNNNLVASTDSSLVVNMAENLLRGDETRPFIPRSCQWMHKGGAGPCSLLVKPQSSSLYFLSYVHLNKTPTFFTMTVYSSLSSLTFSHPLGTGAYDFVPQQVTWKALCCPV